MNEAYVLLDKKTRGFIHQHYLEEFVRALADGSYVVEVACDNKTMSVLSVKEVGRRFSVVVKTSAPISKNRPVAEIKVFVVEDVGGFHELELIAKQTIIPLRQHLSGQMDLDLSVYNVVNVNIDEWPKRR